MPNETEDIELDSQINKRQRKEENTTKIKDEKSLNYLDLLYPKNRNKGQLLLTKLKSSGCNIEKSSGELTNIGGVYIQEVLPYVLQKRKGPIPRNLSKFLKFLVKEELDDFILNPNCADHFEWYMI